MSTIQTSFLNDFASLSQPGLSPQELFKKQIDLLQQWLFTKPSELFSELRGRAPIFVPDGAFPAVISLFTDVVEVASLNSVFSVKPYSVAMMRDNGGPNFILGMDNSEEYDFNLSVLKLAIQRTDLERIRSFAVSEGAKIIAGSGTNGTLELVQSFARYIPLRLCGEYFGIPGPDLNTLSNWTHAIFTDIFFDFSQDPEIIAAGTAAGKALADYVDGLIAGIKKKDSTDAGADTIIRRLIAMQSDPKTSCMDLGIRVNLTGCINGITDNVAPAVVNIIDFLLSQPDALKATILAAQSGNEASFQQHVLEAFRFGPAAPFLVRVSLEDHHLAKGTPRAKTIPAGKLVLAATGSAMMDETIIDRPLSFKPGRPQYQDLQFGFGMHSCLGKYIAQVLIVEMVRTIITLKGIRRASGPAGYPVRSGPFPTSFTLQYDPSV